jgi:ribosomal protein L34
MGGGMMGRRMGYSQGSNGKPISRSKNPGILAMSKTAKGRKVVKERFKFNPDRIVAKKGGKA